MTHLCGQISKTQGFIPGSTCGGPAFPSEFSAMLIGANGREAAFQRPPARSIQRPLQEWANFPLPAAAEDTFLGKQ